MLQMRLIDFTHDENFPFFIQYGTHDGGLYMHTHDVFSELVIITEGSAKHVVDNESYNISKGDVFVISNDTAHGFTDCKNFKLCNIMFKPSYWANSEFDITKTAGFQALFVLEPQYSKQNHFCSRLKLSISEYAKIFEMCDFMHTEYKNKSEGWQTMFLSGFLRLISELSRLYTFEHIHNNDSMLNLAKAIAYMETHYTEEMSLGFLSKLSNYSERQFIRVFKQVYECKPTEYIRKLRVRFSCKLLKSSAFSITDIALKCGYNDSNYFSRVFRVEMGQTPTEYRNGYMSK